MAQPDPPNAPVITKVVLKSRPGVSEPSWDVFWRNTQGNSPASVQLVNLAGQVFGTKANEAASPILVEAAQALSADETYAVEIAKAQSPNFADRVTALWRGIEKLQASVEGAEVEVSWNNPFPLPQGLMVGNKLTLSQEGSDQPIAEHTFYYLNATDQPTVRKNRFHLDSGFDSASTYTLTNQLFVWKTSVNPPPSTAAVSVGPISQPIELLTYAPPVMYVDNPGDGTFIVGTPAAKRRMPEKYRLTTYLNGGQLGSVDLPAQPVLDGEFFGVQVSDVPAEIGHSLSFSLREVSDSTVGPEGAPGVALQLAPKLVAVTVESGAGAGTMVMLSVDFGPGPVRPTGTKALVYDKDNKKVVHSSFLGTTGSFELPDTGEPPYEVKARAQRGASLGPQTQDSLPILTQGVVLESADWNGQRVQGVWQASKEQAVTGYRLLLFDGAQTVASAEFGASTGSMPAMLSPDRDYQVAVQSFGDRSTGPPGRSLPVPARTWRPWPVVAGKAPVPAVVPIAAGAEVTPADLVAYLPPIYSDPPSKLPASKTFVLASSSDHPDFAYTLSLSKDSAAWIFGDQAGRMALQQEYTQFLSMLEGMAASQPADTVGTLAAAAVSTVQQVIARLLPQTFDETLYYNYGVRGFFATGNNRMVDLRQGMRVRIDFEAFQNLGSSPPQFVNGYVGRGASRFGIVGSIDSGSGGFVLGLDAFLSLLSDLNVADAAVASPAVAGAGGAIDFYASSLRAPFYRVIYPTTFPGSDGPGSANPSQNVVIVAAQTWTALERVTKNLLQGASVTLSGSDYALAYLRGRAVVTPLIRVGLRGQERWIPVGTTLRQLLQEEAQAPLRIGSTLQGPTLLRASGVTVLEPRAYAAATYVGRLWPVRLAGQANTIYASGDGDVFDLPLLHGDRIED